MQELLDDDLSRKEVFENKHERRLSRLMMVQVFIALGATLLAGFYDIVSILVTGPIGSIFGMIVFLTALGVQSKQGVLVGISAPIISLACFLVIYTFHWTEREAQVPISMVLGIYTTILMVYLYTRDSFLTKGNRFFENKHERHLFKMMVVQVFIALGATLLAGFYGVGSLLVTGPIGSIYGMIVLLTALGVHSKQGIGIGISAPMISLGSFLSISLFHWTERDAHIYITMALGIYTAILIIYLYTGDFFSTKGKEHS